MPTTNKKYWVKKITNNRKRDRDVNKQLRQDGWRVIRLWEYDIKKNLNRAINKICDAIAAETG